MKISRGTRNHPYRMPRSSIFNEITPQIYTVILPQKKSGTKQFLLSVPDFFILVGEDSHFYKRATNLSYWECNLRLR